jgi:hypothetical protein
VPPRGLPGNANLEQLKKGAKSFQRAVRAVRAVRAGDAGAAQVVRELHPRLSDALPGSPVGGPLTDDRAGIDEFRGWRA